MEIANWNGKRFNSERGISDDPEVLDSVEAPRHHPLGTESTRIDIDVNHEANTTDVAMTADSRMGGVPEHLEINLSDRRVRLTLERRGPSDGALWLLLPALSTVSSRGEWHQFADAMKDRRQLVSFDWPGFGDSERPAIHYNAAVLSEALRAVLAHLKSTHGGKITLVAAGHSAAIALGLAEECSSDWQELILVAPTFRGPLPTMTGRPGRDFDWVRQLVEAPVLGPILYRLNTSRSILKLMLRRHVWVDRALLSKQRIREQQLISRKPGARFASVAFVSGGLDSSSDPSWWIEQTQQRHCPLHVVLAMESPPRSQEEMLKLAECADRITKIHGRLGLHEEFGRQLAQQLIAA